MGMKSTDLNPVNPTVLTPAGKDVSVKAFTINRTDTVASVKAMLPSDATMIDFLVFGVASNAGTTATISVGTTSAATELINAQDVKAAGGLIRPTTSVATTLPNVDNPPASDIALYGKYAETGVASSAGGPYTVLVFYVR